MTRVSSKFHAAVLASVLVASSVWLYTTPTGQSVRDSIRVSLPSSLLDALPKRFAPKEAAPAGNQDSATPATALVIADPV